MIKDLRLVYKFEERQSYWGGDDSRHFIIIRGESIYNLAYLPEVAKRLSDMRDWCENQFGVEAERHGKTLTGIWRSLSDNRMFVFKNKDDAMLFKMVWSSV